MGLDTPHFIKPRNSNNFNKKKVDVCISNQLIWKLIGVSIFSSRKFKAIKTINMFMKSVLL